MSLSKTDFAMIAVLVVSGTIGFFTLTSDDLESGGTGGERAMQKSLMEKRSGANSEPHEAKRLLRRAKRVRNGDWTPVATNALPQSRFMMPAEDAISKELLAQILAALTPERRRAVAMREALDLGERRKALHEARALMDSEDRLVRLAAVGTLGWLGSEGLPELTEMLNDSDPEVAQEAMEQWQQAYKELSDDGDRAELIVEMIGLLDKQEDVDWMLMEFPAMDESISLAALSDIAQQYDGKLAGESGREMYDHIAGEEYVSPQATEEKIAAIEAERNGVTSNDSDEVIDLDANLAAVQAEREAQAAEIQKSQAEQTSGAQQDAAP